jgi:hypothetical protein
VRFKPTLSLLFFLALTGLVASIAKADLPYVVGTMTLTAISNYSKLEFPTDPTAGTALRPNVYAGTANSAVCPNSNLLCDSCAAGPPAGFTGNLYPCNSTAVYPALKLHIEMKTTSTTAYTSIDVTYKVGAGTATNPSGGYTYDVGNKILTMDIPWSELCTAMGGTSTCTNLTSGSQTISFGLGLGSATPVDKIDLQIIVSGIDSSNAGPVYSEACDAGGAGIPATPTPAAGVYGTCYYKAMRGDGKVYIDPIISLTGYPTFQSGIAYGGIAVFYAADTPDNIKTQTASRADFNIPTAGTAVADNRVTGLSNGTKYCFVVANKDVAGNVFYYLPTTATNSPSTTTFIDPNIICATPDTVVGLLDDKSCFIATAAFGSQMAPEVETFRKFRNQFLLPSTWGRGFVKTYYKLSPPLADFIARHDTLRAAARGFLWPLLFFAKISLEWGILWSSLAAAALVFMLWEALRRLRALQQQRKTS